MLPLPSEFGGSARGPFCLLRVRKHLEIRAFERFLVHFSLSLLPSSCLLARGHLHPVGKGSAAIRRTMLPNGRRVR